MLMFASDVHLGAANPAATAAFISLLDGPSRRAQALYLGLEAQILAGLAGAAQPDQALNHFDRFLSGLPGGVQVFSLFTANPHLLDLIVEICESNRSRQEAEDRHERPENW